MECKCDLRTRLVGDGCEACNPELALERALDAYWAAGFAEGAEGSDHDTPDGDAQRALLAVKSAVAATVAAAHTRWLGELDVLERYEREDGRRTWHSVGAWLRAGQVIAVVDVRPNARLTAPDTAQRTDDEQH